MSTFNPTYFIIITYLVYYKIVDIIDAYIKSGKNNV